MMEKSEAVGSSVRESSSWFVGEGEQKDWHGSVHACAWCRVGELDDDHMHDQCVHSRNVHSTPWSQGIPEVEGMWDVSCEVVKQKHLCSACRSS